jgi:hypothetical protein
MSQGKLALAEQGRTFCCDGKGTAWNLWSTTCGVVPCHDPHDALRGLLLYRLELEQIELHFLHPNTTHSI